LNHKRAPPRSGARFFFPEKIGPVFQIAITPAAKNPSHRRAPARNFQSLEITFAKSYNDWKILCDEFSTGTVT
jgi:hypothetical protein